MASALGVTEPYSAGVGGGGYFVYYDAKTGKVQTLDGRETAPAAMPKDAFIDPKTGQPYRFTPELVTSGVSVGTPGTPATWDTALDRWGRWSLKKALQPSIDLARNGFVVDDTFRQQTLDNKTRFNAFTSTRKLYLPGGDAPAVGSTFRNPDLANTLAEIAKKGTKAAFYRGTLAREIARAVQNPPKTSDTTLPVPPGLPDPDDLKRYRLVKQAPTKIGYRGYDIYGMAPSSSGGSTVGEALNILETEDIAAMDDGEALHHYLEASALAFADRGAYVGDPAYVDVPLDDLLSDTFAKERACEIGATAMKKPTAAGDVEDYDGVCDQPAPTAEGGRGHREHLDDQPHRHRQVGQRRGVHAHHRADRRLRDRGAGSWVPAQQRADRLLDRLRRGRPEPDPAGQAAALLDVARRSCCRTASPSSRSAPPAARRSSPPCCRCCSTGSTAA